MAGPLSGYRIIEVAGIGPGPFCAMMLADMGADVIRVDRAQNVRAGADPRQPSVRPAQPRPPLDRHRPEEPRRRRGPAQARRVGRRPHRGLPARRDGAPRHRPRRLPGPQPEARVRSHDRAGARTGPYAAVVRARHQLHRAGRRAGPHRAGRRGPGAAAQPRRRLRRRRHAARLRRGLRSARGADERSGSGHRRRHGRRRRGADDDVLARSARSACSTRTSGATNLLDTGAHFYDVYACADGKYISIGSIEPQFYAELLRLTGSSDDAEFASQMDKDLWPVLKDRLEVLFHTKTRDEWCEIMEHTDVCFAPVLTMSEAAAHPHNLARRHVRRGGRRRAARPGAALQPHHRRGAAPAGPPRASTRARCSADWGVDAGRDRQARSRPELSK